MLASKQEREEQRVLRQEELRAALPAWAKPFVTLDYVQQPTKLDKIVVTRHTKGTPVRQRGTSGAS